MNARPILLLLVLSITYFSSCKKSSDDLGTDDPTVKDPDDKDPDKPDPSKTLVITFKGSANEETSQLQLESSKDALLFVIESDPEWTANAEADWIKLASYQGDAGKMGLIVGFDENMAVPRSSRITLTAGKKTHIISVNQSGAPHIRFSVNGVSFKMILVEGGKFTMGHADIFESRWPHEVSLNSYYICETEVTNALWKAVTGSLPYDLLADFVGHTEHEKPNYPVSAVTWNEVSNTFLPALSSKLGFTFKLPTEAQWEYAATGGKNQDAFVYAGSNTRNDVAWNYHNSSKQKQPVAQLLPNSLGLYDMSGNVNEWCADWYKQGYNTEAAVNPSGPPTGTAKVIRGGDYDEMVIMGYGFFHVKARSFVKPDCMDGCWGNTGNPDEPICFRCTKTGFRFVLTF
jgi:formylglycine-generating enzyme required for sulfatase activity